ncbi:hypothetical protein CP533_3970 [Ophiocordyceps camponoti-saundersi (nom. inval.)]|nr:hypothetical protein CP533_3970 [Ophiocordyceps camponoti-saundersi (nom. inval.)]
MKGPRFGGSWLKMPNPVKTGRDMLGVGVEETDAVEARLEGKPCCRGRRPFLIEIAVREARLLRGSDGWTAGRTTFPWTRSRAEDCRCILGPRVIRRSGETIFLTLPSPPRTYHGNTVVTQGEIPAEHIEVRDAVM